MVSWDWKNSTAWLSFLIFFFSSSARGLEPAAVYVEACRKAIGILGARSVALAETESEVLGRLNGTGVRLVTETEDSSLLGEPLKSPFDGFGPNLQFPLESQVFWFLQSLKMDSLAPGSKGESHLPRLVDFGRRFDFPIGFNDLFLIEKTLLRISRSSLAPSEAYRGDLKKLIQVVGRRAYLGLYRAIVQLGGHSLTQEQARGTLDHFFKAVENGPRKKQREIARAAILSQWTESTHPDLLYLLDASMGQHLSNLKNGLSDLTQMQSRGSSEEMADSLQLSTARREELLEEAGFDTRRAKEISRLEKQIQFWEQMRSQGLKNALESEKNYVEQLTKRGFSVVAKPTEVTPDQALSFLGRNNTRFREGLVQDSAEAWKTYLARDPKGLETLLFAYDSKEDYGGEPSFEGMLAREVIAGNPRALELVQILMLRLNLESNAGILTTDKANAELAKYRQRLAYNTHPIHPLSERLPRRTKISD
jgi:hypothetical protein